MDIEFVKRFDSNNKFHVKWLKDLVNFKEGSLVFNPLGIRVENNDMYIDIVTKLSKKFINDSVLSHFGDLFSYEWAYQDVGEYENCEILHDIYGFKKGTYFRYALVNQSTIEFYMNDEDYEPTLIIKRF